MPRARPTRRDEQNTRSRRTGNGREGRDWTIGLEHPVVGERLRGGSRADRLAVLFVVSLTLGAGAHLVWGGTTVGKWGQQQRKAVTDARLRRVIEECASLPGYKIFKYHDEEGEIRDVKARDLNAYVKEVMGEEFTPKDFRTWAGTLIAAVKLAELGATADLEQAEKNVLAAVDDVAHRLGNTRDIARASYVSPRVIDHYLEGSVIAYYGEQLEEVIAAEQGDLTEGEKALLDLLNKKLRRELERAA